MELRWQLLPPGGGGKPRAMNKEKTGKRLLQPNEEAKTFGRGLNFAASEAYRLLRTNVLFALPDERKCRVVGVTSSLSGEGKSTTALNLCYMLAESGKKTLLVETDMRLPTLGKKLGLKQKRGLSNLLVGLCEVHEAVQPSGIQDQLQVISAGDIPPNPSELLGTEQMKALIQHLSGRFEFIILDLPPVNEVSDALVASRLTNGMLMVVRQGYATRSSVAEAMRQLSYSEAKVLGFVVTRTDGQGGKYKSYRKGQYGYRYSRSAAGEGKESRE